MQLAPAALVFDLDGTLIDSRRDITTAINRTRDGYGLPPLALEQVVTMVGEGARLLIERAMGADLPEEKLDDALATYLDHYAQVCLDETRPYPGIFEVLERLSVSYPLALLSNKGEELSRRVLQGLGLDHFFLEILGGDSLSTRKPDPAGLRLLAGRLGVPVEKLLLVGDTRIDAETARNAGCAFALVEWGFRPEEVTELRPDLRVARAEELLDGLGLAFDLDPEESPERAGTGAAYAARLAATAGLLALFLAGHLVKLPLVHLDAQPFASLVPRMTLLALGMTPLVTAFILVELFAVITTPGRRLRAEGTAGRRRLNRAALTAGLALSAVQALGMAMYLESFRPGFATVVDEPGWLFRLLVVATLTAVTALIFTLGNLLSDFGIGNGFALLLLAETGWWTWASRGAVQRHDLAGGTFPPLTGLFVMAVLVFLLVRFVRGTEPTRTPPFPQGVLPVQWGLMLLSIPGFFALASRSLQAGGIEAVPVGVALLGIPLFSWLTFHLFSSRPRLAANLPEPEEVLDEIDAILRRRLIVSTALLTGGAAALLAWNAWQPAGAVLSFQFIELVFAAMIGLDVWDQFRFLRRQGETVRLVQLDNVHLSYRLAARLRDEGIDVLARGQRFRSLFFFLGALYKIDMIVPADRLERAHEVLVDLESAPQTKVF